MDMNDLNKAEINLDWDSAKYGVLMRAAMK